MHPLGEVVGYFTSLDPDTPAYVKSSEIAADTTLTPHQVAARLCHLRDNDNAPITLTQWSATGSSHTYKVVIEDAVELRNYLDSLSGQPEPTLDVTTASGTDAARKNAIEEASR
jgi:hypothetical protein